MLCGVCVRMLRGHQGQFFGGTYLWLSFIQHESAESLWQSVVVDCSICCTLRTALGADVLKQILRTSVDLRSTAQLYVVDASKTSGQMYRLDISVEWSGINIDKTFVFKPTDDIPELSYRSPTSFSMDDAEVFELALSWLKKCTCVDTKQVAWYPTRLLDLSALKSQGTLDVDDVAYHDSSSPDDVLNAKVKIVETDRIDWTEVEDYRYVTLSHRWGNIKKPVKLTSQEKGTFEAGLRLKALPKTFQDAILFAIRLERVGYIWIDSMCIIQDDTDDWLQESALMEKVYRKSFLNISATAAENSDEGLYSHRDPQFLWDNEIILNIEGLSNRKARPLGQGRGGQGPEIRSKVAQRDGFRGSCSEDATTRRCLLLDLETWETLVEQAPINRRGWVVQERLLSPRILHFCRGRIAWECTEFEDIEGTVPGMPKIQLVGDDIRKSIPTKGLDPILHGDKLRRERLRGKYYDIHSVSETAEDYRVVCALELWARAVEMYSKTDLTEEKDKLIALSGIASHMARTIGSDSQLAEYVAGLWRPRLVGQLLWKIEPVFRGSGCAAGVFDYPSKRPRGYRAPTFSWASVDAQHGNGVTYGEALGPDDLVLVEIPHERHKNTDTSNVEKSVWVHTSTDNAYGVVEGGHLLLWGWIRRVKLQRDGVFFSWFLQESDQPCKKNASNRDLDSRIDAEQHVNVFMDCPGDDNKNDRLIDSASVFCLPVAFGPPTAALEFKDLICILLEQVPESSQVKGKGWQEGYRGAFRRIGLTKVTPSFDSVAMTQMLGKLGNDQDLIPSTHSEGYDEETGRHLVRLI